MAALTKNDAMPRPTPCCFGERFLPPLAQAHDRAHVHFVEGGEHGGVVLRLDQAARDGGAALGHAHAVFGSAQEACRCLGRCRRCLQVPRVPEVPTGAFARRTSFFITRPPRRLLRRSRA